MERLSGKLDPAAFALAFGRRIAAACETSHVGNRSMSRARSGRPESIARLGFVGVARCRDFRSIGPISHDGAGRLTL